MYVIRNHTTLTNEAENEDTVKRLEAADEKVKKGLEDMDASVAAG